jgi:hypothetical protein
MFSAAAAVTVRSRIAESVVQKNTERSAAASSTRSTSVARGGVHAGCESVIPISSH